MCRMGFVVLDKHTDLAKEYAFRVFIRGLLLGENQGYDSTGVYFYYTDGSYYLLKDVLEPSEFLNQYYDDIREAFFKKDVRLGIFHDRLATSGLIDVRNAQPLRMGELVVAHNGRIPISIGKQFSDTYAFTSVISSIHGRARSFSKFLRSLKAKIEEYAPQSVINLIIFSEKFQKLITVDDGALDILYVPDLDVFVGLSSANTMYENPAMELKLDCSVQKVYREFFVFTEKTSKLLWNKKPELDYPLSKLAKSTRGSLIFDVSKDVTELEEFSVKLKERYRVRKYGYSEFEELEEERFGGWETWRGF